MRSLATDVLSLAAGHLREGRPELAAQACKAVLDVLPGHGPALMLLGSARLAQGDAEAAAVELRRAADACPDVPEAWCNLGTALRQSGRPGEASKSFMKAIDLRSPYPNALLGLAASLKMLGRFGKAEKLLRQAILAKPDFTAARRNLANLLLRRGRLEEALEHAEACPDGDVETAVLAGRLYQELHRPDDAKERYRRALEMDQSCSRARLALAGLENRTCPACDPEDVRRVFDENAASYDAQLLQGLQYRGHLLVADALRAEAGDRRGLSILDAGCGSGLLGPLLKPMAGRLVGVDLSRPMLDQAAARGCYDELVQDDVLRFAGRRPCGFDVVAAADLFCYLGDLGPVLAELSPCIKEGGLIAGTLERLEDGDCRPGPSLRFAHSEGRLRRAALDNGFETLSIERDWLRMEGGKRVDGLVFVLYATPLA